MSCQNEVGYVGRYRPRVADAQMSTTMDTQMNVVGLVGGLYEQRLQFLKVSHVIRTNIVAIRTGTLGVDVDNFELNQQGEQAAEGPSWKRWLVEVSVQLAARWIGAGGVVERRPEEWEMPSEGTVVLRRALVEGFETSGERRRHA